MKKNVFALMLIFTSIGDLIAQSFLDSENIPVVGKPCPDFMLKGISNYSIKNGGPADFKGKWLFLDFWFRGCGACIQSMPKVSRLQKEFRNDAVFLLVGLNDQTYNEGIEQMYETMRTRQDFQMAYVFDSVLPARWDIHSMPHIVVVNPQGIVEAITDGRDMTSEKVAKLVKGEKVSFFEKDGIKGEFNPKNFASSNNDNIISQSLLTKWNGEVQSSLPIIERYVPLARKGDIKEYTGIMCTLNSLYMLGYAGTSMLSTADSLYHVYYSQPVLEIKDSSLFQYDYTFEVGKNTFNYNLFMPADQISESAIRESIQQDLKKSFGYTVSMEIREVPVWKLVLLSPKYKSKVKSKGGESKLMGNFPATARFYNYSVNHFFQWVEYNFSDSRRPYVNGTGIENIDLDMIEGMATFEGIRKSLRASGLDLVPATHRMKAVVIRDPKN